MSRVNIEADLTVYAKDSGEWGKPYDKIAVTTYWNDIDGRFVVLDVSGHTYVVAARDLRVALDAVTRR